MSSMSDVPFFECSRLRVFKVSHRGCVLWFPDCSHSRCLFGFSLEALLEVLTTRFLSREQLLEHRPTDVDGEEDTVAEGASTCDETDP